MSAPLRTESLRRAGVLLLALASGLACTAIFAPRDDVQRCGTSDDCEATGDNRYVAVCRFDPENMLDSTEVDKICVADFAVIACRPSDWDNNNPEHSFTEKVDQCDDITLECDMDRLGSEGCERPPAGECDPGLEPNDNGICVEEGSDEIIVSDADFREQAVLDQFCKSYFCDDEFVCDASEDSATCVRCDPELPFGEGGCGLLYANGAPAPVYVLGDELEEQCDPGEADPDDMLFGDCS